MHTIKGVVRKNINTPKYSHGSSIDSLVFGSEGYYDLISQATIIVKLSQATI